MVMVQSLRNNAAVSGLQLWPSCGCNITTMWKRTIMNNYSRIFSKDIVMPAYYRLCERKYKDLLDCVSVMSCLNIPSSWGKKAT